MSPCFSFEATIARKKSLQQPGGARGFATGAKKPKAPVRPKEREILTGADRQKSIDVWIWVFP